MPGTRKLGRPTDHRKAMLRGMVTYLLEKVPSRQRWRAQRKYALSPRR